MSYNIKKNILKTAELLALDGEEFVYEAYKSILNREADPTGFCIYLKHLKEGVPKIKILEGLRCSSEGRQIKPSLTDLDKKLRKQRRAQWPVIGWFFRKKQKNEQGNVNQSIQNKLSEIEKQLKKISKDKESYEKDRFSDDTEHKILEQLPPHARGIYRKLKTAIAHRQR